MCCINVTSVGSNESVYQNMLSLRNIVSFDVATLGSQCKLVLLRILRKDVW